MELNVQSKPLHFLRCIMQEVHFHDESADTIVPDSLPDILSILHAYADPIIRGKDCRNQSATIAGGIKGGILYLPEKENIPRHLDLYIPFSIRLDHAEFTENTKLVCSIRIRSVDAKIINSRKATLRVCLGCEIAAYENVEETLYEVENPSSVLQTRTASYRIGLPLETTEKSFSIHESLDFNGHPPVKHVYKVICKINCSDQKISTDKVIYKGDLTCKILYMTKDDALYVLQQNIPYSNYCELNQDYEDGRVEVVPVITGYDLDTDHVNDTGTVHIHINALSQCVVWGEKDLRLIDDAYVIRGDFEPKWKQYDFAGYLDVQQEQEIICKMISTSIRQLVDRDLHWDFPVYRQMEDTTDIVIPATLNLIGYGNDRELLHVTERVELKKSVMLANSCKCITKLSPTNETYMMMGSGIELQAGVRLETTCLANSAPKTLCGGTIGSFESEPERSASVIVTTVQPETMVWDLAKRYKTTTNKIMEANHLSNDYIESETILLLPIK